jgi:hypothetical protein
VGAGTWLASLADTRTGTFTTMGNFHTDRKTQGASVQYPVGPLHESLDARYAYFTTEARLGWRLNEHFEVSAGVEVMLFVALTQPRWKPDDQRTQTGNCATTPVATCVTDGLAEFDARSTTGKVFVLVPLGIGARYAF